MRMIQFTDTHLLPENGTKLHGEDTFVALRRAVRSALSLKPPPDIIVVTGDIAEDGSIGSYIRFKSIFKDTDIPVLVTPGNHDDLDAMRTAFSGSNIEIGSYSEWKHWSGIFVHSQVVRASHGNINSISFKELEASLERSKNRPTMIALHHPPLSDCPSTGCKLQNDREFLKLISKFKNVKMILAGHLHQDIEKDYSHFKILVSPSTFAQGLHPEASTKVDVEDFWASHALDISKQGFRVVDLLASGEFKTETKFVSICDDYFFRDGNVP